MTSDLICHTAALELLFCCIFIELSRCSATSRWLICQCSTTDSFEGELMDCSPIHCVGIQLCCLRFHFLPISSTIFIPNRFVGIYNVRMNGCFTLNRYSASPKIFRERNNKESTEQQKRCIILTIQASKITVKTFKNKIFWRNINSSDTIMFKSFFERKRFFWSQSPSYLQSNFWYSQRFSPFKT